MKTIFSESRHKPIIGYTEPIGKRILYQRPIILAFKEENASKSSSIQPSSDLLTIGYQITNMPTYWK